MDINIQKVDNQPPNDVGRRLIRRKEKVNDPKSCNIFVYVAVVLEKRLRKIGRKIIKRK